MSSDRLFPSCAVGVVLFLGGISVWGLCGPVCRHRLCADIMQANDEGVRRAILFAVGNTVISDELDDARTLCFGSGEKVGHLLFVFFFFLFSQDVYVDA